MVGVRQLRDHRINDRASAIAQVCRFEPAVVTMDSASAAAHDPAEGPAARGVACAVPNAKVIAVTGQNIG
jgi:hypothetical protein